MCAFPTVSVLMTAYNREVFITQAIESVLASTFRDFELIIVDDCSKDQTVEKAKVYARQDSRIRVYSNQKNLGDYPNRNRAAELAQGRYLKYVDSDDIIYPHGLQVMVASMEVFPEAGLGLSHPAISSKPYPVQVKPIDAYREHFLGPGLLSNAPLSAIIQADAFRSVGGFSGIRQLGDMELWLKLAAHFPTVKMVRDLAWWRSHGKQEFAYDTEEYKTRLAFTISIAALESPDCPLAKEERNGLILTLKRRHSRRILSLAAKSRRLKTAYRLFKSSGLSPVDLFSGLTPEKS